jgi:hypothetical protein
MLGKVRAVNRELGIAPTSEAGQAAERGEGSRLLSREYVYPDYVDQEALTALAVAKGIVIDPVGVGFSRSRTAGWSLGQETTAGFRTPVAEAARGTSTTLSENESVGESISIQRRQTMRWLVDEIAAVLRSEGALREDLAVAPVKCENEMKLTEAVGTARAEWGLSEISAELGKARQVRLEAGKKGGQQAAQAPGTESEGETEQQHTTVFAADYNPQRPTPVQLALALSTVEYAAADVVREALLTSTEAVLAQETRSVFSLLTLKWGFWNDGGETFLWNAGVLAQDEPEDMKFGVSVVQIQVDETKLNTLARARYVHKGPFQPLRVFGKVERVERERGRWIIITPVVILSP